MKLEGGREIFCFFPKAEGSMYLVPGEWGCRTKVNDGGGRGCFYTSLSAVASGIPLPPGVIMKAAPRL